VGGELTLRAEFIRRSVLSAGAARWSSRHRRCVVRGSPPRASANPRPGRVRGSHLTMRGPECAGRAPSGPSRTRTPNPLMVRCEPRTTLSAISIRGVASLEPRTVGIANTRTLSRVSWARTQSRALYVVSISCRTRTARSVSSSTTSALRTICPTATGLTSFTPWARPTGKAPSARLRDAGTSLP
jgi:hypothetical protein